MHDTSSPDAVYASGLRAAVEAINKAAERAREHGLRVTFTADPRPGGFYSDGKFNPSHVSVRVVRPL